MGCAMVMPSSALRRWPDSKRLQQGDPLGVNSRLSKGRLTTGRACKSLQSWGMGGRRLRRFILGVNSCWLRSGMERNLDRHCGGSDRSPSRSNCLFSALWNLESGNPNLRGLSEFLYLYRFQVKPLQARPQATLRRNSCPDYPAAPRISRRFCGLHYVRTLGYSCSVITSQTN